MRNNKCITLGYVIIMMSLAGCNSMSNEDIGTVGGTVAGGLIGSTIGGGAGKTVATIGGAVAGGYIGREIGSTTE